MGFLQDLGNNIGIISGILVGVGVIGAALIKGYKFIKKVNEKIDFIEQLEGIDILGKMDMLETITQQQQTMETNLAALTASIQLLNDVINKMSTKLDDLCVKFDSHAKTGEKTTELLINQARFTLETAMKESIEKGYAGIDEKKLIGSLFASYQNNNGNFGIKDVFDVYKQLPVVSSTEIKHTTTEIFE